jgi:hypothetical protein
LHLAFDIFQGIGIALAIGIRPFVPSLAVGLLAAGDVEIHFDHTKFSFLQSGPFLFLMAIFTVLLVVADRGAWGALLRGRVGSAVLALISLGLGAVFFAGSLCRGGYLVWPGFIAGAICAAIGIAASRPFLDRVRSRLDESAAQVGLPVLADGSALLIAVLSVVAPPIGVIALVAALWLIYRGRQGGDQKYAGLRILR